MPLQNSKTSDPRPCPAGRQKTSDANRPSSYRCRGIPTRFHNRNAKNRSGQIPRIQTATVAPITARLGGGRRVPLGLEEREPNASKGQYGEAGTDGQLRDHRRAWSCLDCRFYGNTVLFGYHESLPNSLREIAPVGRSTPAAQGS